MFSFLFFFFFNPWQILSFMSSQQMKTRQEWTDLNRGGGGGAYAKRFKFIKGHKRAVSGWKPLQNWLSRGLGEARVDTNML